MKLILFTGIDPNPDNFVCAGIIHTRSVQIGVLLRLEPNKQAEVRFFAKNSLLYFCCFGQEKTHTAKN